MSASNLGNGLSVVKKRLGSRTDIVRKTEVISIKAADGTAENVISFVVPLGGIVKRVMLDVKTAEVTGTTKTINVGTTTATGIPNGWLAAVSVATTGIKKGTLLSTGQTLGALLFVDESGTGGLTQEEDVASGLTGTEAVTWTPASVNFAELDADIIIDYDVKVAFVG